MRTLMRAVLIGFLLGVAAGGVSWAQSQQPTMYVIGTYVGHSGTTYRVAWFEMGDVECYVTEPHDFGAGVGISCLRKGR